MAVDKLVDSTQLDTDLTSVADAIRAKSGGSADLAFPSGFVSEIQAIPSGGEYSAEDCLNPAKPTGDVTVTATINWNNRANWQYMAAGRKGIGKVSLPNARTIPANAFLQSSLTEIYAPTATYADTNAFSGCKLVNVVLHHMQGTGNSAFAIGSTLKKMDWGGTGTQGIFTSCFNNCTNFDVLVLRSTTMLPLTNINAFNNTKFASGKAGGTLYVPQDLIASYQAATNWSTILGYANNQILPIEGSIYETQYADGTPIPTT